MVILTTVFMLIACTSDPKTYEDFDHIEHWDTLETLDAAHVVIYYYSPFCDICIALEDDVSELLHELEDTLEVYLIDEAMIYERGE